jgi:lipopolysaccharide/colanic/teichoic acid biosynthesis glycosyltransferase
MSSSTTLAGSPVASEVRREIPLRELPLGYKVAKRTLDILVSGTLLLILFPLFVVVALVVKLTSPGPAFYLSTRYGLGGEGFMFLKLRTMHVGADKRLAELQAMNEKDGLIFKIKHDPRVTPVGAFLRKFSLDELPQLIHVFSGQMSLVGPRALPSAVSTYEDRALMRLGIKPGITCFWQIMGRSDLDAEQMVNLDLRNIEEMNFWCDLKIMLKTPAVVLRGSGAY